MGETIILMTDARRALDLEIHLQKENKLKKIKTLFIYSKFEMIVCHTCDDGKR